MDKRFLAIVGVIVLLFVGFIVFQRSDQADAPANTSAKPTNHTKGEGTSGVTLTEYGDFQCPACAQYFPVVEQVAEKYKEEVTFQFRHFPLVSIHPNAFGASRAAEAASKQDKFWEMYEKLFTNQDAWSSASNPNSHFENFAKQIGLNIEQYKQDFASSTVNDAINADKREAERLGATSTPAFVLDGKLIDNPAGSVEAFSEVLDEAIAKKQQANE